MDKVLEGGAIGSDGKYEVAIKDGKLRIDVGYTAGVNAGLFVEISVDSVLDAMAKVIPGKIDDQVIALIKASLKM